MHKNLILKFVILIDVLIKNRKTKKKIQSIKNFKFEENNACDTFLRLGNVQKTFSN